MKCWYLHSQYIRINKQTQFHKNIRRFVVSKFVQLSDELINRRGLSTLVEILLIIRSNDFLATKSFHGVGFATKYAAALHQTYVSEKEKFTVKDP